jgi:hypothetical protein
MSKHTPGPWRTDGDGIRTLIRGADMTIVAVRHRLDAKTHSANAKLIAAAPELLAVCQGVLSHPSFKACDCGEPDCATTVLRAVIAKATT